MRRASLEVTEAGHMWPVLDCGLKDREVAVSELFLSESPQNCPPVESEAEDTCELTFPSLE